MLNLSSGEDIASPSADDFVTHFRMQTARPPVRAAYRPVEAPLVNPWRNVATLPRPKPASCSNYDHAAPVSPMRDRDIAELAGLFDREDILDLEQNVNHYLIRLFPEPCWEEDDDLHFLKEHL